MYRANIDLTELAPEKTHRLDQVLEDGAGSVSLLLTISGTTGTETISDLSNYTPNPKEREDIVCKYVCRVILLLYLLVKTFRDNI